MSQRSSTKKKNQTCILASKVMHFPAEKVHGKGGSQPESGERAPEIQEAGPSQGGDVQVWAVLGAVPVALAGKRRIWPRKKGSPVDSGLRGDRRRAESAREARCKRGVVWAKKPAGGFRNRQEEVVVPGPWR